MGRPLLRDEVPVGMCKVRALYSWSGESPQDLGFVEGDIIEVLNNGDGDWWTGKLKRNRQVGLFPRNFAEYVDPNQETMPSAKLEKKRHKTQLSDFHLETNPIDFASISLADLAIGESPAAADNRLKPSNIIPFSAGAQTYRPMNSADDQLKQSVNTNMGSSTSSKKSAQEILADVEVEINQKFLDDINLDAHTEDLRLNTNDDKPPTPPPHRSLQSSLNSSRPKSFQGSNNRSASGGSRNSSRSRSQSIVPEFAVRVEQWPEKSSAGPTDQPKIGSKRGTHEQAKEMPFRLSHSLSSDISLNISAPAHSPLLDREIPFDTKEFKPEAPIGDHIGSHFESGYTSAMGNNSIEDIKNPLTYDETCKRISVMSKAAESFNAGGILKDSTKQNFFQKLFPINSQRLRRKFSRSSHKSTRSTASFSSKLKNVKSMFSMSHSSLTDDNTYPVSNLETTIMGSVHGSANTGSRNIKVNTSQSIKAQQNPLLTSRQKSDLLSNSNASGRWIESRRDLYRAQSLTERDIRKKRQDLELQGVNCENLVANLIQQNSVEFHDYRLENFDEIDQSMLNMSSWPQLMTPSVFASSKIGRHFSDPVDRVRAAFLLCGTQITHVEQTPPNNNVMQSRQATAKELAETLNDMCSALNIECVVIDGHIRQIGQGHSSIVSRPHTWNAVRIHNEWRILDCVTAAADRNDMSKMSSSGNLPLELTTDGSEEDEFVNLFYFLTPPSQILFSHIPLDHHKQFCSPSLPPANAFLLPLASPAAFAYNVQFDEFWLGNTRIADFEVSQIHLSVPNYNIDLVAFVDGKQVLAQGSMRDNQRLFRIKAFVPPQSTQALLKIFAVPKAQQNRDLRNLELVWTVELRHSGGPHNNAPYEFVTRHAIPSLHQYDMYISEPQCRGLTGGDTYTFRVETVEAAPQGKLPQPQLAIQSPSGRLTRLVPFGTDAHDVYTTRVKTMEVGTWRAVARVNDSKGWAPFAEWFCS